jgi:hypothetical protein
MIGLISFMVGNEHTAGAAMITSDQMKKDFAKISMDYNIHNFPKFKELFGHQFEEIGVTKILEKRKRHMSESEPLLEGGSSPNSAEGEQQEYIEYRQFCWCHTIKCGLITGGLALLIFLIEQSYQLYMIGTNEYFA